jgi:hypothetical protein
MSYTKEQLEAMTKEEFFALPEQDRLAIKKQQLGLEE